MQRTSLILRWLYKNYWALEYPCIIAGWVVPAGFITDLATIPVVIRIILPQSGPWSRAAVLHDYIYHTPTIDMTRKDCDDLFYYVMEQDHVTAWRRYAAYIAVRLFGSLFWSKRWPH